MPAPEINADLNYLTPFFIEENGPGAGAFFSIGLEGLNHASDRLGLTTAAAMSHLLKYDIWPRRFIRNRGVMTSREQAKLLNSKAVVIGCGGLGGHVATLLARVGLGTLVLCDRDSFEESNLNRQLLCRETNLGQNKAAAAGEELADIASHVQVTIWPEEANSNNLSSIMAGAHIVLDCLDSIAARRQVESAAHRAGLPFVHGSIAGEEGFVMITRPGEKNLSDLYGEQASTEDRNAEKSLGVPTITPAALACLQAAFAVRELMGRKPELTALYHLDLSGPIIESMYI